MKSIVPFILIICAFLATVFNVVGDDGYKKLANLKSNLKYQQESNQVLAQDVNKLQMQAHKVLNDDRTLERYARDQLGLARKGEITLIFAN